MIKFRNRKTGEISSAYSAYMKDGKVHIRFVSGGQEYAYAETTVELLDPEGIDPFIIYATERVCYKCQKSTEVLSYMLFADGTKESLVFPWDKPRLNKHKSMDLTLAHMRNPEIEYYPILAVGSNEQYDNAMLQIFPDRIRMEYSNVQKRKYPMNVCQHCGAKQGEYYIFEQLNKVIARREVLPVVYQKHTDIK